MPNKYLERRSQRRGSMRDSKNPYGSRGGYISSRRDRAYGSDRRMDRYSSYPEYDSRYSDGHYGRRMGQERHMGGQQSREHYRPNRYPMYNDYNSDMMDRSDMSNYGSGNYHDSRDYADYNDYGDYNDYNDYNDYRDYNDYNSSNGEDKWKQHLKKWCEELKRHDRFNVNKEQLLSKAKQMGIRFDNYNEEELLTTYYMVISDFPQVGNDPHTYLAMAKDWLEDKDSMFKGSDKLCAYYYEVVKGGEEM